MFKIFVTLALILAVESARVSFKACSNGRPSPDWIESDSCTASLCTLKRGQVFTASASFTPTQDFNSLIIGVKATTKLGLPLPVDIPEESKDACKLLGGEAECPIRANESYILQVEAPIDNSPPALKGVKVELFAGEGQKTATCAVIVADIV